MNGSSKNEPQFVDESIGQPQSSSDVSLRQEASEAEDWIQEQRLQHAGRPGEVLSVVPGWERALEIVLGDLPELCK